MRSRRLVSVRGRPGTRRSGGARWPSPARADDGDGERSSASSGVRRRPRCRGRWRRARAAARSPWPPSRAGRGRRRPASPAARAVLRRESGASPRHAPRRARPMGQRYRRSCVAGHGVPRSPAPPDGVSPTGHEAARPTRRARSEVRNRTLSRSGTLAARGRGHTSRRLSGPARILSTVRRSSPPGAAVDTARVPPWSSKAISGTSSS